MAWSLLIDAQTVKLAAVVPFLFTEAVLGVAVAGPSIITERETCASAFAVTTFPLSNCLTGTIDVVDLDVYKIYADVAVGTCYKGPAAFQSAFALQLGTNKQTCTLFLWSGDSCGSIDTSIGGVSGLGDEGESYGCTNLAATASPQSFKIVCS